MKKMMFVFLTTVLSGGAFADDGEGLAAPAPGTCDRVAYDAAVARYGKDNGNNAYHLNGLSVLEGGPTFDAMSIEIDFDSAEDGPASYRVDMKVDNKGACSNPLVSSVP